MVAYAYTNQGLKHHSEKTMEYALKIADNNYAEVCAKRIRVASKTDFSPDEFLGLVKITAVLHDSGKAADRYQAQFDDTPPEEPKFSFHEIPSAIIAKSLMEESNYSSVAILLVSMAVLFHHTAMRAFDQQERHLNVMSKPWRFKKCKSDLDEISSIVIGKKIPIKEIGKEETKTFLDWVRRNSGDHEKSRFIKLYCLILNPVIYGDNIDAKSRGENKMRSRFVKELEETING